MPLDSTKLNYDSAWDIDQLDDSGQVDNITLPASTFSLTSVTLKSFSLDYVPVVDGVFQISGENIWRQFGDASNTTLTQLPTFLGCTSTGVALAYNNYNGSDVTISVRYYIWTDGLIQ